MKSRFKTSSNKIAIQQTQNDSFIKLKRQSYNDMLNPNVQIGTKAKQSLNVIRMKFLLQKLIKKIKFIIPPRMPSCKIDQQWEKENNKQQEELSQDLENQVFQVQKFYPLFQILQLVQGIIMLLFCWEISISLVYNIRQFLYIHIFILVLALFKIICKNYLVLMECSKDKCIDQYGRYLTEVFVSTFMIIRHYLDISQINIVSAIVGIIYIIFSFPYITGHFDILIVFAQQKKLRKQLRLVQLFALLLTISHLFGLILYSTTYLYDISQTWLQILNLGSQQWQVLYLYSYYWAVSTMVTVGYGDIVPKNVTQVTVIIFIQFFGTAMVGYTINIIGITVDQIKKKNQQYENLQSTLEKMKRYYHLSQQLINKMKKDIGVTYKLQKFIPLRRQQQNNILDCIQPKIRQQFVLETNIKVIKKSIFFLTHFTSNFQNQIALKLMRIIYKPDQQIKIQQNEEFTMVIIHTGKAKIMNKKQHNQTQILKKVKTIQSIQGKLTLNLFGYSAVIMGKSINLKAIAETTAVVYALTQKDIIFSLKKHMSDFQSYSSLRQGMLQYRMLQQAEVPSLGQHQFHYIPNLFYIIKKLVFQSQKSKCYKRSNRRMKTKITTINDYKNKTIMMINSTMNFNINLKDKKQNQLVSIENITEDMLNQQIQIKCKELRFKNLVIDQCQTYDNFHKQFNISTIATKYVKACDSRVYKKRNTTFRLIKKYRPSYNSYI